MHCRFENTRIYKGMQFDRLKKIAVSDSSQSLVNVIFFFFKVFNLISKLKINKNKLSFLFKRTQEIFLKKILHRFILTLTPKNLFVCLFF